MRSSSRSRRWRTIGQRRLRARSGQVGAVATVLALLLLTSMIAEFALAPLPNLMAQNEFNHELSVEDQLARLQYSVLAQSEHMGRPVDLTTSVTLGSAPLPPFAPPSSSTIGLDTASQPASFSYTVEHLVPSPPNWNASLGCPTTGSPCNQGLFWDNVTGVPNNAYSIKLNGGAPSMLLNFTGSNDTVTVTWLGKSVGIVYMIFNGSFDHVTLVKGSSGGQGAPRMVVFFYGQNDVLETGLNGAGITMTTTFIGSNGQLCPQGDLAASDAFYWNGTSNSNTNVTVTWENSVGLRSGPTTYPVGTNSTLTFQNLSLDTTGCAWTKAYHTTYAIPLGSGLRVHLNNRYSSPADIVYDRGAIVLSHPGVGSYMFSPLPLTFFSKSGGWGAALTLVNILSSATAAQGFSTVGVVSHLVGVSNLTLVSNLQRHNYFTGSWFNISTAYPFAWNSLLASIPPTAVLSPPTCTPLGVFALPYSCLVPPVGKESQLSVALSLSQLTLTLVTVSFTVR